MKTIMRKLANKLITIGDLLGWWPTELVFDNSDTIQA